MLEESQPLVLHEVERACELEKSFPGLAAVGEAHEADPAEIDMSRLLLPKESLGAIKYTLSTNIWVPLWLREYLCEFISVILIDHPDKYIMMRALRMTPAEPQPQHVPTEIAERVLYYFMRWKRVLLEASYRLRSAYIYCCGEVTPLFVDVMQRVSYVHSFSTSANYNGRVAVGGYEPVDQFVADLNKMGYGDLVSTIKYRAGARNCDDSS